MKKITRKIVAATLLISLLLGCLQPAGAEYMEKYRSYYLKQLGMNSAELTKDYPNMVFAAALILMEASMAAEDGVEMFNSVLYHGGGYIAKYGSHLDVFYPVGNGRYLNLFAHPTSGEITDYSFGGDRRSDEKTYYWFSMDDLWGDIAVLASKLY